MGRSHSSAEYEEEKEVEMQTETYARASLQAEIPQGSHIMGAFHLAQGFMRPLRASKLLPRSELEGHCIALGEALPSACHRSKLGRDEWCSMGGENYLNIVPEAASLIHYSLFICCCKVRRRPRRLVNPDEGTWGYQEHWWINGSGVQTKRLWSGRTLQ